MGVKKHNKAYQGTLLTKFAVYPIMSSVPKI